MTKRNGVFIERICHFNSHPHEEDDLYSFCVRICSLGYFNSHPHEEDDWLQKWEERRKENFNSHPHEEDDHEGIAGAVKVYISTHILTKRMTQYITEYAIEAAFQLTSSRRG